MLSIGEMTGHLDHMMEKIAERFETDIEVEVERLNVVLEQLLMLGMSVMVGFVVIALFLPLIKLFEHL